MRLQTTEGKIKKVGRVFLEGLCVALMLLAAVYALLALVVFIPLLCVIMIIGIIVAFIGSIGGNLYNGIFGKSGCNSSRIILSMGGFEKKKNLRGGNLNTEGQENVE